MTLHNDIQMNALPESVWSSTGIAAPRVDLFGSLCVLTSGFRPRTFAPARNHSEHLESRFLDRTGRGKGEQETPRPGCKVSWPILSIWQRSCKSCQKKRPRFRPLPSPSTTATRETLEDWCAERIPQNNSLISQIAFSDSTYLETGDTIKVYDGSGKLVGVYTGDELQGKTLEIIGSTMTIELLSDGDDNVGYGFAISSITGVPFSILPLMWEATKKVK
ncbi:MAG TPA: hypothetical protein VLM37_05400 [Fibrobacteraceae bacterium]|nr:hypothetical protein [Fibrobacteraceae bacterium]